MFGPQRELQIVTDALFGTPISNKTSDDLVLDTRFVPIRPQPVANDVMVTNQDFR